MMKMMILIGIAGGILGFIPGVGGVIASTAGSIGASVAMDMMANNTPTPADTASALGWVLKMMRQSYEKVSEAMVTEGSISNQCQDGDKSTMIDFSELAEKGKLLEQSFDNQDYYPNLVKNYEHIFFQQVAVYTWTFLQKDDYKHIPFIAFDNGGCTSIDHDGESSLPGSGII